MKCSAYYGLCPRCGDPANFIRNVGPEEWCCCDGCEVRWCIGAGHATPADPRPSPEGEVAVLALEQVEAVYG